MSNDILFVLAIVAMFACVALFAIFSWILIVHAHQYHKDKWWFDTVVRLTSPGGLMALAFLAVLSIPYFFLYPERHMTFWDFEGTDEQRMALKSYRSECAKRGILRRAMENSGFLRYSGPDWPDILTDVGTTDETGGDC